MRCGPSSGWTRARADAAVRNPAVRPMTTSILTPGSPRYTIIRPGDPDSVLDQARRDRTPLFADIFSLRDARIMVDRGVTGFLHMIRDTEAIDPAFIARLRDLRIVFVPMLAEERNPAELALAKRNTKRLADGGVPIAVGSGGDMQREMDLMVE